MGKKGAGFLSYTRGVASWAAGLFGCVQWAPGVGDSPDRDGSGHQLFGILFGASRKRSLGDEDEEAGMAVLACMPALALQQPTSLDSPGASWAPGYVADHNHTTPVDHTQELHCIHHTTPHTHTHQALYCSAATKRTTTRDTAALGGRRRKPPIQRAIERITDRESE